jgi:predicted 3-demethylubiquinone-9 3-methyltransferase (glyoxalase superfamily)
MPKLQTITPCLWFDHQAEEAAGFYVAIFPDSRITRISRYGKAGEQITRQKPGTVMTVEFELAGQAFTALNGGPSFRFTEAISLQVMCDTQEEIDHYWEKLGAGGDPAAQQCGWLKDRHGLSWQVVPRVLAELTTGPDDPGFERAFAAMLGMRKLDKAALERAYAGD